MYSTNGRMIVSWSAPETTCYKTPTDVGVELNPTRDEVQLIDVAETIEDDLYMEEVMIYGYEIADKNRESRIRASMERFVKTEHTGEQRVDIDLYSVILDARYK